MLLYRAFSHSTKGAIHAEDDPCQDTADHYNDDNMAIAVVADGHGSGQYFRSEIGSRLAVEIAITGIKKFIEQSPKTLDIFKDKDGLYATRKGQRPFSLLIKHITSAWLKEVAAHERAYPLPNDPKFKKLDAKYQNRYLNDPERRNFSQAYGTTLIAVAMTQGYWFGLHIGDGRCEVLFDDGEWQQPIPWDERCFLNSTTSICDDDASTSARVWYGAAGDAHIPLALFLNSDGLDDTYSVDEELRQKDLEKLYGSVVLSFAKDGFDSTNAQIHELIERFAAEGSRDDVSVSGIISAKLPKDVVKRLAKNR